MGNTCCDGHEGTYVVMVMGENVVLVMGTHVVIMMGNICSDGETCSDCHGETVVTVIGNTCSDGHGENVW